MLDRSLVCLHTKKDTIEIVGIMIKKNNEKSEDSRVSEKQKNFIEFAMTIMIFTLVLFSVTYFLE